jgi:hypothetical protein
MVQLNITTEDKQVIAEGRYTQPHPRVMQKYDALHLYSKRKGLRIYQSEI